VGVLPARGRFVFVETDMARVAVVGSLNMDLVIKASHLPAVGETVLGSAFATFPGGKGANQAVAAARLGAAVAIVGRVGDDAFGRQLRDGLAREGIDVSAVRTDTSEPTGVALITVDGTGRNTIVVASGANMAVTPEDVDAARDVIARSTVLLLQLEVPVPAVRRAAQIAHAAGGQVILDPAPAPSAPLPDDLYRLLAVINPNEVEARALTGIAIATEADARQAAEALLVRGCQAAVLKLGERGAYVAAGPHREAVPAVRVEPVDTTAAGDAFAAGMGVALAEGKPVQTAVHFATVVGALKVTRLGAQPSMPTGAELREFARQQKLAVDI
jgi:ribokinase